MTTPSLRERLEGALAGAVTALPEALQRVLAGGKPARVDGLELALDMQVLLRLAALSGRRGFDTMTPEAAMAETARTARVLTHSPIPLARVAEQCIPGPAGDVPARLYVPREDGRRRALAVYYHGGGWVVGDLDTHDAVCRFLAREADVSVLAVDYRRAPEHRFPAAVDDALAAFEWAVREAAALGSDPARVAVAGDSAGGNLAAVVAQIAVRQGGPRPAAQLLVYPVTDLSTKHPSYRLFAEGFFLTEAEMDWYRGHYLPDGTAALDSRASPLLAANLRDLPPAVVLTAGFDVLRDEGEAYARRLEEAGIRVVHRRYAGLVHGFANATGVSPASRNAMGEAARLFAAALATA